MGMYHVIIDKDMSVLGATVEIPHCSRIMEYMNRKMNRAMGRGYGIMNQGRGVCMDYMFKEV